MQLLRLLRWITLTCSALTACQLYFNPTRDTDQFYAWLLNLLGYLFAEIGWPHRAAGLQICIVLQVLSFTCSLSVTSRLSGVNLRFWDRGEVCKVHWHVHVGEKRAVGRQFTWDAWTSGVLCRSRSQQLNALLPVQEDARDRDVRERCLISCVRFMDGRWHALFSNVEPGLLPTREFCGEEPVEFFGRCPDVPREGERVDIPLKVEWAKG